MPSCHSCYSHGLRKGGGEGKEAGKYALNQPVTPKTTDAQPCGGGVGLCSRKRAAEPLQFRDQEAGKQPLTPIHPWLRAVPGLLILCYSWLVLCRDGMCLRSQWRAGGAFRQPPAFSGSSLRRLPWQDLLHPSPCSTRIL